MSLAPPGAVLEMFAPLGGNTAGRYDAASMGNHASSDGGSAGDLTPEGQEIVDSIRRIVQVLRISSREAERTVGLTAAQLFVLQQLSGDNALSLNELASRTLTHQSSVSVVAQRLADRGLISRVRSKQDARRVELSLTAAGRRLIGRAPHAAQEHLLTAVRHLSPAPRRQLARLLEQLVHEMGLAAEMPMMFFEEGASRGRERTLVRRKIARKRSE
jgi:DNA-binding MarR family transcriptional regulator